MCSLFECIAAGSPYSSLTSQRSTLKCQWEANEWTSLFCPCWRKPSRTKICLRLCHRDMVLFVNKWHKTCLHWFLCLVFLSFVFMGYMFVCCMHADVKDPSSVQLRPIKDSCVYLWGWGPCPPHRKVHSSGLFPAVWCQNCTHHPSESLEEDGGRIWAAQEPSKASLKKKKRS